MAKGENTRSGLLWEVERLLNECSELPQVLLMENVTQVHGKKNVEHFNEWIKFLESKGYRNYWKDLNAKNFGIPQNRNRTFMVSVLGDYTYEFPKEFPLELRLKDMLEDSVDEKFYLGEKTLNFFIENTKKQEKAGNGFRFSPTDGNVCAKTITTRAGQRMDDNFIEVPQERFFKQALETLEENNCSVGDTVDAFNKRVNTSGISPTITTRPEGFKTAILPVVELQTENDALRKLCQQLLSCNDATIDEHRDETEAFLEGYWQPLAYDEQNGYIRKDGTVGTLTTDGSSPKHNNRVVEPVRLGGLYDDEKGKHQAGSIWDKEALSPTIDTMQGGHRQPLVVDEPQIIREEPLEREGWHNYAKEVLSVQGVCRTLSTQSNNLATKVKEPCSLRIRKLTPKECWRLMGFDDADFEKAAQLNSNAQLYKQAGNSIVVDVLCYIFGQMFI